jgi:hypothetical protein
LMFIPLCFLRLLLFKVLLRSLRSFAAILCAFASLREIFCG